MRRQKNKALVIGIDNYLSDPLTGCVRDAKHVAKLLKKNFLITTQAKLIFKSLSGIGGVLRAM